MGSYEPSRRQLPDLFNYTRLRFEIMFPTVSDYHTPLRIPAEGRSELLGPLSSPSTAMLTRLRHQHLVKIFHSRYMSLFN